MRPTPPHVVVKVNFLTQGKSPHQLWPSSEEFSGVSVVSWVRNSLLSGCKTENSARGCCLFIRIGNTQLSGTFRNSCFLLKKSEAMKGCVSWLPARRQVLSGCTECRSGASSLTASCTALVLLLGHLRLAGRAQNFIRCSIIHDSLMWPPILRMHCSLLGQMRE